MKSIHIKIKENSRTDIRTIIIVDENKPYSTIINQFENILLTSGIKKSNG